MLGKAALTDSTTLTLSGVERGPWYDGSRSDPEMKKKSPTYWRKKCAAWAKLKARERDGDKCQYCGASRANGAAIHGSHILPEGAYPLMSAEPYNIIALCATHHLAGANPRMNAHEPSWHGDPMYFAEWFEAKWPGRYKELRAMAVEKARHLVDWERRWSDIKAGR